MCRSLYINRHGKNAASKHKVKTEVCIWALRNAYLAYDYDYFKKCFRELPVHPPFWIRCFGKKRNNQLQSGVRRSEGALLDIKRYDNKYKNDKVTKSVQRKINERIELYFKKWDGPFYSKSSCENCFKDYRQTSLADYRLKRGIFNEETEKMMYAQHMGIEHHVMEKELHTLAKTDFKKEVEGIVDSGGRWENETPEQAEKRRKEEVQNTKNRDKENIERYKEYRFFYTDFRTWDYIRNKNISKIKIISSFAKSLMINDLKWCIKQLNWCIKKLNKREPR